MYSKIFNYDERSNQGYKNLLKLETKSVDFSDFTGSEDGRFDIHYSDIVFECLIAKFHENYKNLFVFFSSGGRSSSNTLFQRISWCSKLNGICLYIEDPMYKKYDGIASGWYYGDENVSFINIVIEIVKKVAFKNNIKYENISFLGSSSAGYAALYCANTLDGSLAYAYNPQIYLDESPNYPSFKNHTKIDLVKHDDLFCRSDISYITKNLKSNFYIFFNSSSKSDIKHLKKLFNSINLPLISGVQIYNRVNFLVESILNSSPHVCVGELDDFIFCFSTRKIDGEARIDLLNASLNRFKNYILNNEDKFYKDLWINCFNKKLSDFIEDGYISKSNGIQFKTKNFKDFLIYKVSYLRLKKVGYIEMFIRKNAPFFNSLFLHKFKSFCNQNNYSLKIDDVEIKIKIKINDVKNIYSESMDFMNYSYINFTSILNSLIENDPVLKLEYIHFDEVGRFHIGGVFFLRGLPCENYSDLNYVLKLYSNSKIYSFNLAKGNKNTISEQYFKHFYVNYDKAYFCTKKYLGFYLDDVTPGIYKLSVEIIMKSGEKCEMDLNFKDEFLSRSSSNNESIFTNGDGVFLEKK